jgi:hypothetical protein
MVGTPMSRRAVYFFADYEESEYQGRQRITRQYVTVPKIVPTHAKDIIAKKKKKNKFLFC